MRISTHANRPVASAFSPRHPRSPDRKGGGLAVKMSIMAPNGAAPPASRNQHNESAQQ